jgi:hypothetical protein
MVRTALFIFSVFILTACNSGSSDTDSTEKTAIPSAETSSKEVDYNTKSISLTQTLAEYQTTTSQNTPTNCDANNPQDLSLSIENLNNLSQQVFALDTTSSINSYANFIALSQLALTSREHSAALIEQLGLAQVTQNNDWFNSLCQLEQQLSTLSSQVSMANEWQVNKSLLAQLNQYFPVVFTERQIDPESDLWRLSITNNWLTDIQLTVLGQDYIYYRATDSTEAEIAKAIMVSGDITTASNEIGKYIRLADNNSNFVINIIMPTFEQYSVVKKNLINTLNGFRQLEQNQLETMLIPYFSNSIASDDFFNIANWISHNNIGDILAEEGQNFTGINAIEKFKLLSPNSTNGFIFDETGKIKAQSSTRVSYEALAYLEEAFQPTNSSSVTITSGNFPQIPIILCHEKLVAQDVHWRPYFILIENASNGLIYTMTKNMSPVIEDQSNLCLEEVFPIKIIND